MAWTEKYAKGYRGRYRDADNKNRTAGSVEGFTAKAKKEALQLAQREELKISGGTWFDPKSGQTTFSEYFEEVWYPAMAHEHQSVVSYRSSYDAHFKKAFGSMELRKILPSTIQTFITNLQKEGAMRPGRAYAPATVVKLFGQLQSILAGRKGASALRDGFIERNVCTGTRLPRIPRREVNIYEPEEVDALMEVIPKWWRIVPFFMSMTGARIGEVQGVLVDDLTLGYKAVKIRREVVETSKKWNPETDTPFRTKAYTKTGPNSERTIALDPDLRRALVKHVSDRGLGPGDLLFAMPERRAKHSKKGLMPIIRSTKPLRTEAWPGGVPFARNHFRKTIWYRAHVLTDIRKRRPYDLRATNISWLLDGGAPLPVVMELAGHNKMETTRKYTKARGVDTQGLEALARVKARKKSQDAEVTRLSSSHKEA